MLARPAHQSARQRRALRARKAARPHARRAVPVPCPHAFQPCVASLSCSPIAHLERTGASRGAGNTIRCMARAGLVSNIRPPVVHQRPTSLSSRTQTQGRAALLHRPRCTWGQDQAPAGRLGRTSSARPGAARAARRARARPRRARPATRMSGTGSRGQPAAGRAPGPRLPAGTCAASSPAPARRRARLSRKRTSIPGLAVICLCAGAMAASTYVRGIIASACAAARAPQLEACLSFILPNMSVCGRRGCQLGATQEISRRAGESLVIYARSEPLAARHTTARAAPGCALCTAPLPKEHHRGALRWPVHAQRGEPRSPPGRAGGEPGAHRAWSSGKTCVGWLDMTPNG